MIHTDYKYAKRQILCNIYPKYIFTQNATVWFPNVLCVYSLFQTGEKKSPGSSTVTSRSQSLTPRRKGKWQTNTRKTNKRTKITQTSSLS